MAASKLIGPGRLPSPDNLKRYSPQQLVKVLGRFGMQPDLVALNAAATRSFERLDALIDSGVQPDDAAWKAVGQQLEKEVGGYLRKQVKDGIKGYRVAKLQATAQGEGIKLTWIGVGVGMCPSCEPRHGKTKTLRQWKRIGLPGSAALVCQKECRCGLHPNTDV